MLIPLSDIITECGRSGRAEGVSSPQPVLRLSEEGDQRREAAHSGDKARHAPNGHGVDRLFHVGFGRYVLHGDLLYRQREGFGNLAVEDRKRVVWGKSVSVRVDLGGPRIIKQKIHRTPRMSHMPQIN